MTVRLLLDEILSDRLLPPLVSLFPGSTHVRTLGRSGASDTSVWELARDGGFVLATRDEDFDGMSVLVGLVNADISLSSYYPRMASLASPPSARVTFPCGTLSWIRPARCQSAGRGSTRPKAATRDGWCPSSPAGASEAHRTISPSRSPRPLPARFAASHRCA